MIRQFLKVARIRAADIYNDTLQTLVKVYGQSRDAFSYSSSWGMLLLVLNNHFQLILHYFQDALTELNPLQARRNNSIYGNAALMGHSPARNRAASGEIAIRPKDGTNGELTGNKVFIPNLIRVKSLDNLLTYSVDLKQDDVTVDVTISRPTFLMILEGVWDFQVFTGTGEDYQSFEVNAPVGQQIDNDHYQITVNGKAAVVYENLLEIPFGELGCIVTTGIFSGIDVLFGNQGIHEVPELGAEIRVDYLTSNGRAGNSPNVDGKYEFVDTGFDVTGSSIDLNAIFDIRVEVPPILGANSEPPELTKRLTPQLSRYTVLHDRVSISYFFTKLNLFNVVKVFRDDEINGDERCTNQYTALLIPRIQDRITSSEDYFSTDINNFVLTDLEVTKLTNVIEESGRKSASIHITITKPVIRRYIMTVFIEAFETYQGVTINSVNLKQDIRSALNEYLLKNDRVNKIPHSDIVKLMDNVPAVDSVKVMFLSQDGTNGRYGIDNLGNINLPSNEIAVVRGGWTDFEGVQYDDSFNPENDKAGSINIFINFVKQ